MKRKLVFYITIAIAVALLVLGALNVQRTETLIDEGVLEQRGLFVYPVEK